jgi:hypothetical protein
MPTTPPTDTGYEETTQMPRGRKARKVPQELWIKLADSAKRGVAFARTAAPDVIDELRRDLGSAAVRAKYIVTVDTDKASETAHKLTFAAVHKHAAKSETPAK